MVTKKRKLPLLSFLRAGDSTALSVIAIEYCVLSVLKAKFLQLAPKYWGGDTWLRAQTSNMWLKYGVFGLNISIFAPRGLQSSFFSSGGDVWGEKEGKVWKSSCIQLLGGKVGIPTLFPL